MKFLSPHPPLGEVICWVLGDLTSRMPIMLGAFVCAVVSMIYFKVSIKYQHYKKLQFHSLSLLTGLLDTLAPKISFVWPKLKREVSVVSCKL